MGVCGCGALVDIVIVLASLSSLVDILTQVGTDSSPRLKSVPDGTMFVLVSVPLARWSASSHHSGGMVTVCKFCIHEPVEVVDHRVCTESVHAVAGSYGIVGVERACRNLIAVYRALEAACSSYLF